MVTSINSLSSSGYTAAEIATLFSVPSSSAPGADTASPKAGASSAKPPATSSAATIQAIIQSAEANSKAGQMSVSLADSAYSDTASTPEASSGSGESGSPSANGTASGNWMSQDISKFEAAWKAREAVTPDSDAYDKGASAAIANYTMTYIPASQVSGLNVSEDTTTWTTACGGGGSETKYGYCGDALNSYVNSQGKSGGLVIWGDTPEQSVVALW